MHDDSLDIKSLCSRAGAYTHGTVIPVDGGTSINHRHVGPHGG